MSSGRIIQIIGAVIDVEFERSVPKIYDALQVDGTETTLEVQQQLAWRWCCSYHRNGFYRRS
jgi:F-type H+-transporting ATPase subunit beta